MVKRESVTNNIKRNGWKNTQTLINVPWDRPTVVNGQPDTEVKIISGPHPNSETALQLGAPS